MTQQLISIGAAPNDGTGDPLRTAWDKANDNFTELYALQSQIVNAGAVDFEGAGSTENRIQAAIDYADALPAAAVFVPASMLPYNASLVTFATGVRMVREGGDFASYDVQAYGADPTGLSNATVAIQAAMDALDVYGGVVVIPSGRYIITASIILPPDTVDGRTLEIKGYGEAVLHNQATTNNPTFKLLGPDGQFVSKRVKIRDIVFTGESGYPNHAIHLRWAADSEIEGCVFCMWGSGIYSDGGLFSWAFRKSSFWPSGDRHRSPTVSTSAPCIHFDTPVANAAYCHTMTFDDLVMEGGSMGVKLAAGYAAYAWRFGRILAEGLTGGNGWALDLEGLYSSEIGPFYTEFNSPGVNGDANDQMFRFDTCRYLTVLGGYGSGRIEIRDCTDLTFVGTSCQKFDADSTNARLTVIALKYATVGGGGSGYTNASADKTEIGVIGAGATPLSARVWGAWETPSGTNQFLRATTLVTDAGNDDDVRKKNTSIRWEENGGTRARTRVQHLVNSVADNGDWNTLLETSYGMADIVTNNGEAARVAIRGAYHTVQILSDALAIYSVTKDTAAKINIYWDGATSSYHLQNKSGNTLEFTIWFWGTL